MLYAPRALTSEDLPLGQHGEMQGLHRKVFVPINGERPDQPIRANLVARKWGKHTNDGMFWTLDVNGQRLIVQAFPNKGCVTGAKRVYCPWTGVEHFEETPWDPRASTPTMTNSRCCRYVLGWRWRR